MKKNFFPFLFLFLILIPNFALALEIQYPSLPGGAEPPQEFLQKIKNLEIPKNQALPLYVNYIFNLAIWLTGLIAFMVLVIAGIRLLFSRGKPEAIISAKKQIFDSFLAILILLCSWILFDILNPQLKIMKTPELPVPKPAIERPQIPMPQTKILSSSIDTEIPFGEIINDHVFESSREFGKARLTRIKENVSAILKIADEIEDLNNTLVNLAKKCKCFGNTLPDPRCATGCGSCEPCPPSNKCTCDPCKPVRGQMENIQKQILQKLEELKTEEEKLGFETKDLKIELSRLERVKKFMENCPLWRLNSFIEFLQKTKFFKEQKMELRKIQIWNDVDNIYYSPEENKLVSEYATFYCQTGGTIEETYAPYIASIANEKVPELLSPQVKSCPREIPAGELIDRSQRLGKKMVETFENIALTIKKFRTNEEKLHVSISKCSSVPCHPVCNCPSCPCPPPGGCTMCVEVGCFGDPCPLGEIQEQNNSLKQIKKQLKTLIEDENLPGVIPLIDKKISNLLNDLDYSRKTMQTWQKQGENRVIYECARASGASVPLGGYAPLTGMIRACCSEEQVFQDCLENCYLENGQEKYRQCLQECLDEKAKTEKIEQISWCRHRLNFYGCHIVKESEKK